MQASPMRHLNRSPGGAAVLVLGFAACASDAPRHESRWPPPDYYLEATYFAGVRERQRARFFGDGTVLYAEATGWVGAPDGDFPVYSRSCAYRMRPASIRHLSRLLERAGLYALEQSQASGPDLPPEAVVLHWRAFDDERVIAARTTAASAVVRALHVINAFLPPDHPIRLREMTGEPEPPHLVPLPEPRESAIGALQVHLDVLAKTPDDRDLLLHAFALAVTADERETAAELLARLERGGPDVDPAANAAFVAQLRRLL